MKLKTRVWLGFGGLAVIGIAVGVFGALGLKRVSLDLEHVTEVRMQNVQDFTVVMNNQNEMAELTHYAVMNPDAGARERAVEVIQRSRARNSELLTALQKRLSNPRALELFRTIQQLRPKYNAQVDEALASMRAGDQPKAMQLAVGPIASAHHELIAALAESNQLQKNQAVHVARLAQATTDRDAIVMCVLSLGWALAAIVLALRMTLGLKRALGAEPGELAEAVGRVADGDLAQRVNVLDGDETSTMAAVHRMQQALSTTVAAVRRHAESVAQASEEIATGSVDLSQRTEEQAASLAQTAATMDELGATVRNNADNARLASELARTASSTATDGGDVVEEVVGTMRGIESSSQKISEIIAVIDGIAFQTNILALNAAVEAARAGEQGRGFAVVANEVRMLAQRSAEAAREIKTLITASVEQIGRGTTLVDRAGSTMQGIVASIQKVSDIVGEISSSSVEQSNGVQQVGQTVAQMDQVTQSNAALVEQSAVAAENLREQARQMVSAVAVFRLQAGADSTREAKSVRARAEPSITGHSAMSRPTFALATAGANRRGTNNSSQASAPAVSRGEAMPTVAMNGLQNSGPAAREPSTREFSAREPRAPAASLSGQQDGERPIRKPLHSEWQNREQPNNDQPNTELPKAAPPNTEQRKTEQSNAERTSMARSSSKRAPQDALSSPPALPASASTSRDFNAHAEVANESSEPGSTRARGDELRSPLLPAASDHEAWTSF